MSSHAPRAVAPATHAAPPAATSGADQEPEPPARAAGSYAVKPGDTLGGLAKAATGDGSRYLELNLFNGRGERDERIEVGQILRIPTGWNLEALDGAVASPDPAYVDLVAELLEVAPDADRVRELWERLDDEHRVKIAQDASLLSRLDLALEEPARHPDTASWALDLASSALDNAAGAATAGLQAAGQVAAAGRQAATNVAETLDAVDRRVNPGRWAKDSLVSLAGETWAAWAGTGRDHEAHAAEAEAEDAAAIAEEAPAADPVARLMRAAGPTFGEVRAKQRDQHGKVAKGGDGRDLTESRAIDPTDTLAIAQTRADLGDAGTHYKISFDTKTATGKAERDKVIAQHTTGSADADTFWCSGFNVWTLAAAGYDMAAELRGEDGKPYTYTEGSARDPRETAITMKAIVDGQPEAVEALQIIRSQSMKNGGSVGRVSGQGHMAQGVMTDEDGLAASGAAALFELTGMGARVDPEQQKPGDFAQSRHKTQLYDGDGNVVAGSEFGYRGAGHAWQVWSTLVRGDATFGRPGSPVPVGADLEGPQRGVQFWIDKDTDPALVHSIDEGLKEVRIEANVAGVNGLTSSSNGGDGGVVITGEKPFLEAPRRYRDQVLFYGRLGSSRWAGWTPNEPVAEREAPPAATVDEYEPVEKQESSWWNKLFG